MQQQSRRPTSNQPHLHPRLADTVGRQLKYRSQKPVARHNVAALELLLSKLSERPRPLVLDSFCGSGHSTAALAQRHPRHLVVGIDKSGARLERHPETAADNYLLLQADCEALWQLLGSHQLGVDYHYMLYPNPWPKAKHLQRRVHGSAGFYWVLQLAAKAAAGAGRVELRSNWQNYVEEFGTAMHLAGCPGSVARVLPEPPLSLFEHKYHESGHELWAFVGKVSQSWCWPV